MNENIKGERFGRLSPFEIVERRNGSDRWLCFCDCGQKKVVSYPNLIYGRIRSCGCLRRETTASTRFKDLTGKKFGKLFVKYRVENIGKRTAYLCVCDCGREKILIGDHLVTARTSSCGCLRDDPETIKRRNGNHSTPDSCAYMLYKSYQRNAKLRNREFSITFDQFKEVTSSDCHYCHAKPVYKTKGTKQGLIYIYNGIDRKDNDLGYTTENCIPACQACNYAKQNSSYEDFTSWLHRIAVYYRKP